MKAAAVTRTAHEFAFIPIHTVQGWEDEIAELLTGAVGMVRTSEPDTMQWLALKQDSDHFAIAAFFLDSKSRDFSFHGQVTAALRDDTGEILEGGWDKGVVPHVENDRVMASTVRTGDTRPATLAVRIELKAKHGKEGDLAKLLVDEAHLIEKTEPDTLLWYAIRLSRDRFAIFAVFPGNDAMAKNSSGKVASILKAKAKELIEGGWTDGVAPNIKTYQVLSATW